MQINLKGHLFTSGKAYHSDRLLSRKGKLDDEAQLEI